MNETEAKQFAHEWISAWNDHDVEGILSHYAEDVQYYSPFVTKLSGEVSGCLKGHNALRSYVEQGLKAYPALRFELFGVFAGIGSLVLHYRSVNDLNAAEFMEFDQSGKITRLVAHYSKQN